MQVALFIVLISVFCIGLSVQKCSPEFQHQFLTKHNELRARHGSPPLELNNTISQWSQYWADTLAYKNIFQHSQNGLYGENLYMNFNPTEEGGKSVEFLYTEISKYHSFGQEPDMDSFMSWGHFTQLVWKSSKQVGVGCGFANGKLYIVSNYYPPGNWVGQYAVNVPAPLY